MKVILLQDIRGLGKRNDIKEVNDGYARNFLIAKKLAIQKTPSAEAQRETHIKKEKEVLLALQETAHALAQEPFNLALKTGAHGEVFSSIGKEDIKKALIEKGYKDCKEIELAKPLRTTGTHKINIHLGRGIQTTITVIT